MQQCSGGLLYQVWGEQMVIPSRFRQSPYLLENHYEGMSHGKRGFEDFRVICCACHLAADFHCNRRVFLDTACVRCSAAVDHGFRNVRHHMRVMRMLMQ